MGDRCMNIKYNPETNRHEQVPCDHDCKSGDLSYQDVPASYSGDWDYWFCEVCRHRQEDLKENKK